jgi:tripartite-type tricarboxylate transporter receptor subunit TctC
VALPHVKAGKLRLLGVARPTRMPYFPDTPTMAEAGTDANVDTVFGVHGPARMPRDVVLRLNREIGRAMQSPEVAATLSSLAAELVTASVDEFAAQQRRDRERYGAIVREVGIKAD